MTTKAATAIICLSPYSGGMEIDSIKLAHKLSPYAKVVLIAKKDHFIANEVAKKAIPFTLETIKFSSSIGPSLIFAIRELIKKHAIKNVIFFGASELKAIYFSLLGMDTNLIVRHGTTKSHPKKDWFHRLIYSRVDYHVAICEHLATNVKKIIPFGKKTKLKVIYPSIEVNGTAEQRILQGPLQILHLGRIAPGKGQRDAIQACEILHKHQIDFTLNLVGGGDEDYVNDIKSFAQKLEFKKKVIFHGRTNEPHKHLSNNDLFLFPSSGEGLSNAFIEALTYGLACVAYQNTSFPELQQLGFYCHLAKDKDINEMRLLLLEIAKNIHSEKNKCLSNIALGKKIFSQSREVTQYLEILD